MNHQRRRSILDAAERLFGHYGTHKTTIGDIARDVGIGVGSVYLEFASKDEIVAELASDRHRRIVSAMRKASRHNANVEAIGAALEARVRALFDLAADGAHACDLVSCSSTDKARAMQPPDHFDRAEHELLVELLRSTAEANGASLDGVEDTALTIERAYATLSPPWVFAQRMDEAIAAARHLNQLILPGLLTRRARASKRSPRRR